MTCLSDCITDRTTYLLHTKFQYKILHMSQVNLAIYKWMQL